MEKTLCVDWDSVNINSGACAHGRSFIIDATDAKCNKALPPRSTVVFD